MQGFELAAISVPPSDFHNFFEVATGHRRNAGNRAGGHFLSSLFSLFFAPSSLLSSALDSRNIIPSFLQGIMRPRGVLHCKNEAIRGGPGANKPCCQSIWGSLAAFFVISSLFSLLSFLCSLPSSLPGADPFRFSLRSSLVSPRARPFSLPSRPSGTKPLPCSAKGPRLELCCCLLCASCCALAAVLLVPTSYHVAVLALPCLLYTSPSPRD